MEFNHLHIAKSECKALGVRVGRIAFLKEINNGLVQELIDANALDILRIKLYSPTREIYTQLDQLNLNYYILNITQIFERKPDYNSTSSEDLSDIEFVDYTEELSDIIKPIVRKSFSNNEGTYFNNPKTQYFFSKEDELKSMIAYIAEQYNNGQNVWSKLIRYNGQYVGFVSYLVNDSEAEGDLIGVLPQFQHQEIGRKICAYALQVFKNKTVKNAIQIQNFSSLKMHYSLGMKPVDMVLNIHINSSTLLSKIATI